MFEDLGNLQGITTFKSSTTVCENACIIKKQTNKIPHERLPKYQ